MAGSIFDSFFVLKLNNLSLVACLHMLGQVNDVSEYKTIKQICEQNKFKRD